MCFDSRSSLLAWSLSYSISIYLYNRNRNYDRWNAAFITTFSTIQLFEAGIWASKTNEVMTKTILVALLLQPTIQSYMGYKYVGSDEPISKAILGTMSFIFLGMVIWGFKRLWSAKPGQFNSCIGPNGHLVWNDTSTMGQYFLGNKYVIAAYLAGISVPLLFMKDYRYIPLVMIGITTAIYSITTSSGKEFGSYWCFTAVAYAIVSLFL